MVEKEKPHEGNLLKKYLSKKRIVGAQLCKDIGRSTNYLQAQYRKPILDRETIQVLNEALEVNLVHELGLIGTVSSMIAEPSAVYSSPSTSEEIERVIIDFKGSTIVNIKRGFKDKPSPEEEQIAELSAQLNELKSFIKAQFSSK
ncbi:MAG: hypothetical protein ACRBFS_22995 [Aureispira sp.]